MERQSVRSRSSTSPAIVNAKIFSSRTIKNDSYSASQKQRKDEKNKQNEISIEWFTQRNGGRSGIMTARVA